MLDCVAQPFFGAADAQSIPEFCHTTGLGGAISSLLLKLSDSYDQAKVMLDRQSAEPIYKSERGFE
jgi:hypothetical protein